MIGLTSRHQNHVYLGLEDLLTATVRCHYENNDAPLLMHHDAPNQDLPASIVSWTSGKVPPDSAALSTQDARLSQISSLITPAGHTI